MTLDQGLSSLGARATWVRALLLIGIVSSIVAFAVGAIALAMQWGSEAAVPIYASDGRQMIMTINALLSYAISLASIVLILMWIHRAHTNLRLARVEGLNYSPAWAVGCYFVPFANLVAPFRTMRELHNRSHGEEAHFAAITVEDVNSWWACFVTCNAIALFLGLVQGLSLAGIYIVTPRGVNTALALFANVLGIGASLLLYRIVGAITRAQRSTAGVSEAFA